MTAVEAYRSMINSGQPSVNPLKRRKADSCLESINGAREARAISSRGVIGLVIISLYGDLYTIVIRVKYYAFIVSISRISGSVHDFVSICFELSSELVHFFF